MGKATARRPPNPPQWNPSVSSKTSSIYSPAERRRWTFTSRQGRPTPPGPRRHLGSRKWKQQGQRSYPRRMPHVHVGGLRRACIDWTLDTPFRVLPILDCKNAVRFLRVHAQEYHIDPSRIAIGGGSGGGYLASMVGFTAGEAGFEPPEPYPGVSSAVSAVIDFYGGYDAMKFPLVQKQLAALTPDLAGVRPALEQINLFQPVTHLTPAVPPVLIVHGRDDSLIDFHQAIEMDHNLTAKGVRTSWS